MGARATAIANCSGSFPLSFRSLNTGVNTPSKDIIPDKNSFDHLTNT